MTKKRKLTVKTCSRIKELLNSSDPETRSVGFQIIESCDFERSIVHLMILARDYMYETHGMEDAWWKKNAPESWIFLSEVYHVDLHSASQTLRNILVLLSSRKYSRITQSDYNYLAHRYSLHLIGELNVHIDPDIIVWAKLTIKKKHPSQK